MTNPTPYQVRLLNIGPMLSSLTWYGVGLVIARSRR